MTRLYRFIYCLVYPFFSLCHPQRVIGKENIPSEACVICSNHSRNSDPLFLVFSLGRHFPLRIMAKEEMLHWPIVGPILARTDLMIWVKRGKADIGAVRGALKTLKESKSLLMFPEGTRSEEISEGKTGVAMIALRAGVPVLPIYLPAKKKWFRRTPLVIGEAYQPFTEERKPNLDDYRNVTDELMLRIGKLKEQTL